MIESLNSFGLTDKNQISPYKPLSKPRPVEMPVKRLPRSDRVRLAAACFSLIDFLPNKKGHFVGVSFFLYVYPLVPLIKCLLVLFLDSVRLQGKQPSSCTEGDSFYASFSRASQYQHDTSLLIEPGMASNISPPGMTYRLYHRDLTKGFIVV